MVYLKNLENPKKKKRLKILKYNNIDNAGLKGSR